MNKDKVTFSVAGLVSGGIAAAFYKASEQSHFADLGALYFGIMALMSFGIAAFESPDRGVVADQDLDSKGPTLQ
jgi:hypothetical protein